MLNFVQNRDDEKKLEGLSKMGQSFAKIGDKLIDWGRF